MTDALVKHQSASGRATYYMIRVLQMYATLRLALLSFSCLVVATGPAHAYLDPGTGSILLQGLVAAVAGGLVAARLYWSKVKQFFSFAKRKNSEPDGDAGA